MYTGSFKSPPTTAVSTLPSALFPVVLIFFLGPSFFYDLVIPSVYFFFSTLPTPYPSLYLCYRSTHRGQLALASGPWASSLLQIPT